MKDKIFFSFFLPTSGFTWSEQTFSPYDPGEIFFDPRQASKQAQQKKNVLSECKFRSYDLWVMSPTRFRCANSLLEVWPRAPALQLQHKQTSFVRVQGVFCVQADVRKCFFSVLPLAPNKKLGGSGYRSRFSTLRRLYATMYNNPPNASFGTRTRTYTLEGCNSTLKLRMQGKRQRPSDGLIRAAYLYGICPPERLNGRVV